MSDQSTDSGIMPNPNNYVANIPMQTAVISLLALVFIFFAIHFIYKTV